MNHSSLGFGHFFFKAFSKLASKVAFHQSLPRQIAYLPRMPLRSAPANLQLLKLDKFETIEKSGHFSFLENTEEVSKIIQL